MQSPKKAIVSKTVETGGCRELQFTYAKTSPEISKGIVIEQKKNLNCNWWREIYVCPEYSIRFHRHSYVLTVKMGFGDPGYTVGGREEQPFSKGPNYSALYKDCPQEKLLAEDDLLDCYYSWIIWETKIQNVFNSSQSVSLKIEGEMWDL